MICTYIVPCSTTESSDYTRCVNTMGCCLSSKSCFFFLSGRGMCRNKRLSKKSPDIFNSFARYYTAIFGRELKSCIIVLCNLFKIFKLVQSARIATKLVPVSISPSFFLPFLVKCSFSTSTSCNGTNPLSTNIDQALWFSFPRFNQTSVDCTRNKNVVTQAPIA